MNTPTANARYDYVLRMIDAAIWALDSFVGEDVPSDVEDAQLDLIRARMKVQRVRET